MAMGISKQATGFRFGQHRLEAICPGLSLTWNGRTYRVLHVRTQEGLPYVSLRLYNATGKFIKQFLMEPEAVRPIAELLLGMRHE